jgi:hypothetical protein
MATKTKSKRRRSAPALPVVQSFYYQSDGYMVADQDDLCGEKYKRRKFVPLDNAKRFEWLEARWRPTPAPKIRGITRDAVLDYVDNCALPRSFVDVPADMRCGGDVVPSKWLTREEAFRTVAEMNRQHWKEQNGRVGLSAWCLVVELGAGIVPCGLQLMEIHESGIGHYELSSIQPMRIALPTPAELAKYAIGKAVSA